jgi:hypothetical protein
MSLLRQKVPDGQVIAELEKEGVTAAYAEMVLSNVYKDIRRQKEFWINLAGGILLILTGICINIFSYRISVNADSFFFYCFWGIIAVGIIQVLRAFIIFKK